MQSNKMMHQKAINNDIPTDVAMSLSIICSFMQTRKPVAREIIQ